MKGNNIKVSIVCAAYNHEPYIREALQSFVCQKTDFAYEVLVHDDASADHTQEIIHEFEQKYPKIIKPIYQTENQYSHNINIYETYCYPKVSGQYIALCEGDDFWTDINKLQRQADAMDRHPELDMCTHSFSMMRNNKIFKTIRRRAEEDIIPVEEVILGGGGYFATNSLFFRAEMIRNIPDFINFYPLDYAYQIWGALRGGMLYLSYDMSVYRTLANGSWTERMNLDTELNDRHRIKVKIMMDMINEETNYKYDKVIKKHLRDTEFENLYMRRRYTEMKQGEFREMYLKLPFIKKLKIFVKQCLDVMRFVK